MLDVMPVVDLGLVVIDDRKNYSSDMHKVSEANKSRFWINYIANVNKTRAWR